MEKKCLLAVYDFMIDGKYRHHLIQNGDYVGTFISEPNYIMTYDINTKNVILIEEGDTAIYFEVYEVPERTIKNLEFVYGCAYERIDKKYTLKNIETPFGEAKIFIYSQKINYSTVIESGNVNSSEIDKFIVKTKYGQE